MATTFRSTDLTRAIRAARAAGLQHFDATVDAEGRPIIKVRPANDTGEAEALAELEAWDRDHPPHAA